MLKWLKELFGFGVNPSKRTVQKSNKKISKSTPKKVVKKSKK